MYSTISLRGNTTVKQRAIILRSVTVDATYTRVRIWPGSIQKLEKSSGFFIRVVICGQVTFDGKVHYSRV